MTAHNVPNTNLSFMVTFQKISCQLPLSTRDKVPGALLDAVQTFLYLIDEKEKHRLNPKNIILMGDSAGAGLCCAMLLYLRDHNLPQPGGAVLLSVRVYKDLSCTFTDHSLYSLGGFNFFISKLG